MKIIAVVFCLMLNAGCSDNDDLTEEPPGRWFTSINAWKVDRPMAAASQAAPMGVTPDNFAPASAPTAPASSAPDFGPANPIDDLPF